MVACAKYLGRDRSTCTRGIENCFCRREEIEPAAMIRQLIAENARLKDLLRQIAYPRRGTEEDRMDIFDAAKLIQDNFTAEELGCDT